MSTVLWKRTPLQAVRVDSLAPPGVSLWSAWLNRGDHIGFVRRDHRDPQGEVAFAMRREGAAAQSCRSFVVAR